MYVLNILYDYFPDNLYTLNHCASPVDAEAQWNIFIHLLIYIRDIYILSLKSYCHYNEILNLQNRLGMQSDPVFKKV